MYGKLFATMYEGSLYGQWQALVTLQQMIVLCDMDGTLDMTPQALAARTSIPLEIIQQGITLLEQPDAYSRSSADEGRRIVRIDSTRPWGWRIVNYGYYRNLASAEEKRRKDRERIAEKRMSQPVADCRNLSPDVANVAHAEAEAEVEEEASKKVPTEPCPVERDADGIETVFQHWKTVHGHPRARLDAKRKRVIRVALANYTTDELCESISGYLNSPHHMGVNERGTRYDDIEVFLRDAKHIDAGLAFGRDPPANVSSLTRKNIAAVEGWMPPEVRHADR